MKPKDSEHIYTDEVDYDQTSAESVWGTEDQATLDLLAKTKISGHWLNLCAGDGRFNNYLLSRASRLTALDVDESALRKLVRIAPNDFRKKLDIIVANIVKPLPFANHTYDGVFCVGTLHLFPRSIFTKILAEVDRVLRPGGEILIDFATDIKRVLPDNSLWVIGSEPSYTLAEARSFLENAFADYRVEITEDRVEPERLTVGDKIYTFSCNFLVVNAKKAA
ncbi:MAG: class I SAM-dependent methyltransferase [Candidatus Berkelbacteria bacterium]|nr:class I SAM-dependent methyltransferase [Candidatus Berkelbacteria bacterium]